MFDEVRVRYDRLVACDSELIFLSAKNTHSVQGNLALSILVNENCQLTR